MIEQQTIDANERNPCPFFHQYGKFKCRNYSDSKRGVNPYSKHKVEQEYHICLFKDFCSVVFDDAFK